MKTLTRHFVVVLFALCTVFSCSLTVFADVSAGWSVDRTGPEEDRCGWIGNGSSRFTVDSANHTSGSRYSIKLDNTSYNTSYVEKKFAVKPYTTYRFSAMVKYSGYSLSPDAEDDISGACIGQAYSFNHSDFTTSGKWTKLEYTFYTGKETEYSLCLQNGIYNANCKGTAWFSDVQLEIAETTNKWNILVMIFQNVDTKVTQNGKKISFKNSISDSDIKDIKRILPKQGDNLSTLSDGKMGVKSMDFVTVTTPVTEVSDYNYSGDAYGIGKITGHKLDVQSKVVKSAVDKQLAKKQYNQIIAIAPLNGIDGGWAGLASFYGTVPFAQIDYEPTWFRGKDDYLLTVVTHEMLHGMEARTKEKDEDKIPSLHNSAEFGYKFDSREWFIAYIRAKLPGGKGVDPFVFKVPNGKYTLVSSDMTTGTGVEQSSSFPIDISTLKVAEIPTRKYNGKAQKPAVTVTDGKYTLKLGVDYTLSYTDNRSVGKGKVTIRGKGIYTGKTTVEFSIVPKPPVVSLKKSGGKFILSWKKVTGAEKYIVWRSIDGKAFERIFDLDKDKLSASLKYSKGHTYQFAITAYIPSARAYTEYCYTKVVKT